jgi:hypothetical protein
MRRHIDDRRNAGQLVGPYDWAQVQFHESRDLFVLYATQQTMTCFICQLTSMRESTSHFRHCGVQVGGGHRSIIYSSMVAGALQIHTHARTHARTRTLSCRNEDVLSLHANELL